MLATVGRRCASEATRACVLRARALCTTNTPPELTTTPSGLMYRDVYIPSATDEEDQPTVVAAKGMYVSVDYTGRLEDGEIFDTTALDRGTRDPIEFRLGAKEVIKGWDEGIVGMLVGGKRQLVIPPHLGYGARGAPPDIPPNALLHFDLELVSASREAPQSMFQRFVTLLKALPIK